MSTPAEKDVFIAQLQRELAAANTFLRTDDDYSEADLIDSIQNINYSVTNLACQLSDFLHAQIASGALPIPSSNLPAAFVKLFNSNASIDSKQTLFELFVQCKMLKCCVAGIRPWCTESEDANICLANIHQSILENEESSVSAVWRAITYRATSRIAGKTRIDEQLNQTRKLRDALLSALREIGLRDDQDHAVVEQTLESVLDDLSQEVVRARANSAQGVLSVHLEPVFIEGGAPIDSDMRIALEDGNSLHAKAQNVLCTMSLGLRRIRYMDGRSEMTLLLVPGVVSDGFL